MAFPSVDHTSDEAPMTSDSGVERGRQSECRSFLRTHQRNVMPQMLVVATRAVMNGPIQFEPDSYEKYIAANNNGNRHDAAITGILRSARLFASLRASSR